MADFPAPVANQGLIPPQAGSQTLSNIMGMRQQRADIQTAQANAQIAKQNASQKAGIANWFKNVNTADYAGADGTWDMNKVLTDPSLRQVAGDQYPEVVNQLINVKKGQLDNRKALADLNQDVVGQFNQQLGALRTDKDVVADNEAGRNKVETVINRFAALGPDGERIAGIYGPMVEHAPQGKLVDNLSVAQMQAEDAGTQAANQAPGYADIGGKLVQTKPQAAGAGNDGGPSLTSSPSIKKNLAPTEQVDYQTQLAAAKSQTEANFTNVNNNRTAAATAPQQLNQINNALKLSQSVSTGAGTSERAKLESGISALIPGFDKLQNDAAKVQELNKYLARITTDSEKVLGANATTDASRDAIAQQNASIGYAPQAVQNVLKYAGAQTLAMQAKGNAQEAWLKQSGNGITNQHEFETAWRKAYDPVVFQLEEAGSKAEQQKIINGLTPEEAASLSKKRADLKALGVELP